MKIFKRCMSCILVFIMLLSALLGMVSCKNNGNGENNGSSTTSDNGAAVIDGLKLVENGELKVSIVYQTRVNAYIKESMDLIQNAVGEVCDKKLTLSVDAFHEHSDDKLEILIGQTEYAASTDAMAALAPNSFSVSVSGEKIVIVANNSFLYPMAMEKLLEAVKVENGAVYIAKDFSFKSESYPTLVTLKPNAYKIVYEAGNTVAKDLADQLKLKLYDAGLKTSVTDDSADATGYEILIGDTNRELSKYEVSHDTFRRALIKKDNDGNISLAGNITEASNLFAKYVTRLALDGKGINLIEPMFGNFFPEKNGRAPEYKGSGTVEWCNSSPSSNSYYMRIHDATKKDYNDYIELLKAEGFEEYYSTSSNGQLFSTWTDGYNILNVSYISYYDKFDTDWKQGELGDISYITIGVDCIDNSALPEISPDIKEITTVQMTTVSTGYVLRLADGRFLCWDGGVDADADTIYKIICDQNVREGKPVIAAWFMTHNHGDHYGALKTFARKYGDKVDIEALVHNMPARELVEGHLDWELNREPDMATMIARLYEYYDILEPIYPNADIIVCRAGQRFQYGDIAVDILFTVENMYKKDLYDGNGSSMISSITNLKTGKRMIETGDASITCCALLSGIYEDELKCNVIQVPHHGANGGHYDMYSYAAADIAIWNTTCGGEVVVGNGRCWFDYTTVIYNVVPLVSQNIILAEDMTLDDLAQFNRPVSGRYGRYEGGK